MSKGIIYVLQYCRYTSFSSTHFLRFPVSHPSAHILPASGYSGIHETATLLFIQPAFRYFSCFIQCSEQKKIQQFIAVGLKDKLWPIIQADHGWVATTYSYPLQESDYALRWQIKIDLYVQYFPIKVINHIEVRFMRNLTNLIARRRLMTLFSETKSESCVTFP